MLKPCDRLDKRGFSGWGRTKYLVNLIKIRILSPRSPLLNNRNILLHTSIFTDTVEMACNAMCLSRPVAARKAMAGTTGTYSSIQPSFHKYIRSVWDIVNKLMDWWNRLHPCILQLFHLRPVSPWIVVALDGQGRLGFLGWTQVDTLIFSLDESYMWEYSRSVALCAWDLESLWLDR